MEVERYEVVQPHSRVQAAGHLLDLGLGCSSCTTEYVDTIRQLSVYATAVTSPSPRFHSCILETPFSRPAAEKCSKVRGSQTDEDENLDGLQPPPRNAQDYQGTPVSPA